MLTKLALLSTIVSLQACVFASIKDSTQEICVTKRTSPSPQGAVRTTNLLQTVWIPREVTVTSTPVSTITPSRKTLTVTATSTSIVISQIPVVTDTFTTTVGSTSTIVTDSPQQTITSNVLISTTTTMTILSSTIIATPSGFLPVLDTLPQDAARRKRMPHSGSLLDRSNKQPLCPIASNGNQPPQSWPAAVTCVGVVEKFVEKTLTRTARTTTETAATPYTTVTTTSVMTSTSLSSLPDASTTVTITSWATTVSTIILPPTTYAPASSFYVKNNNTLTSLISTTLTTTATFTANVYTATAYAQCIPSSSSNYAGSLSGRGIAAVYEADNLGGLYTTTTGDATPQACCNSCAANPLCAGSLFMATYPAGQKCYPLLTTASSCTVGEYSIGIIEGNAFSADALYQISNGNCGFANTSE